MTSNDEVEAAGAVDAARALTHELGLRPVPPPLRGGDVDVDPEWLDTMLASIVSSGARHVPGEDLPISETGGTVHTLRRRTVVRGLTAAACAAAVALITVVVVRPEPAAAIPPILAFSAVDAASLTPQSGTPARQELLAIAASARAAAPQTRSASATTQHVVTDQWRLEVTVANDVTLTIQPTHDESWLLADGRVRLREMTTAPRFDANGVQVAGDNTGTVTRDDVMAGDGRGSLWAKQLPRDAGQLAESWLAGTSDGVTAPTSRSTILAGRITDVFDRWVVEPRQAATMWTALADMDDVRDLGDATDRAGRPGRAFSIWDDNNQTLTVLIVDASTGALLGQEGIIFAYPGIETTRQLPTPRVGFFVTYLSSSWSAAP